MKPTTIEIIGGVAPSGKWIFFKADADLSHLDESKLRRYSFGVAPSLTRHSVAANGHVYEVLERLGLSSPLEGQVAPGTYAAALRLTTALLRCETLTTPEGETLAPTVGDLFQVPAEVLQQYQFEVQQADQLTQGDMDFFTKVKDKGKPEEAAPQEAVAEEGKSEDAGKPESS